MINLAKSYLSPLHQFGLTWRSGWASERRATRMALKRKHQDRHYLKNERKSSLSLPPGSGMRVWWKPRDCFSIIWALAYLKTITCFERRLVRPLTSWIEKSL